MKYNEDDKIRQKFTGYQRDEETQLDFAEARYYNNKHGRFTAVDPLLASGKSANPQTFNRYVYVMNRPLILTDSTGLQAGEKNETIQVTTQLSKNAPSISNIKVTSNGKPIKDDLYVGDKFTVTYTYRINKPDDGTDPTKVSSIQGTTGTQTTIKDGKTTSSEEVNTEGRNSFGDVEGAKKVGEQVVDKVGDKKDEVEVTVSQTFEITGRQDANTRGGSNQINFQIVVVDPRAPLTANRDNSQQKQGSTPANPAIVTTRPYDTRNEITTRRDLAISYRNRRRADDDDE